MPEEQEDGLNSGNNDDKSNNNENQYNALIFDLNDGLYTDNEIADFIKSQQV